MCLTCKITQYTNKYFASQAVLLSLKQFKLKNIHLNSNWLDHLLLMTSYLVLKMRGRDKQTKNLENLMERGEGCTSKYVREMRLSNVLRKLTRMFVSNLFSKFKPRKISRNRLPKLKCAYFCLYRKILRNGCI